MALIANLAGKGDLARLSLNKRDLSRFQGRGWRGGSKADALALKQNIYQGGGLGD